MYLNSKDLSIPEEKCTRYLLVKRDFDDKSQFLSLGGYTLNNYQKLIKDIIKLSIKNTAVKEKENTYGTFYRVTGTLSGVKNTPLNASAIWLKRKIDGQFQFITLIPERRM